MASERTATGALQVIKTAEKETVLLSSKICQQGSCTSSEADTELSQGIMPPEALWSVILVQKDSARSNSTEVYILFALILLAVGSAGSVSLSALVP